MDVDTEEMEIKGAPGARQEVSLDKFVTGQQIHQGPSCNVTAFPPSPSSRPLP